MKQVHFVSNYDRHVENKRMRVRPNKGVKTDLNVLAKGTQRYEFGKPAGIDSDAKKFNQFGERFIDHRWMYTQTTKPVKEMSRYKMNSTIETDAVEFMSMPYNMLRNILLFKGISIHEIEQDFRLFDIKIRQPKLAKYDREIERIATSITEYEGVIERVTNLRKKLQFREHVAELRTELNKLKSRRGIWKKRKPFLNYKVVTDIVLSEEGDRVLSDHKFHVGNIIITGFAKDIVNNMGKQETNYRLFFDKKKYQQLQAWIDLFNINL